LVGAGVQIDASGSLGIGSIGGSIGAGIEVIIYWDTQECADLGKPIVALYTYNEGGAYLDTQEVYNQAKEIAELLLENIDLIKIDGTNAIQAILSGSVSMNASLSFSFSLVGVFGNSKFYGAHSYEEKFDNFSAAAGSIKYGRGWSDSCVAHSIGYNFTVGKPAFHVALPEVSRGASYYRLIWSSKDT